MKGAIREFPDDAQVVRALLIVEVAESSLFYDRGEKASLYASAGIADYWIVNLVDRQVEVYRQPAADPAARFGFGYTQKQVFTAGQSIRPLAASGDIAISDLLP